MTVAVLERSTNGGRTWERCAVGARSPLSVGFEPNTREGWFDDGCGNLYRHPVGAS